MKIKLVQKNYKEVAQTPAYKNKTPRKQRVFWRFLMKTLSAKDLKDCNFTYEFDGMEKLGKDEPCLFLMNHSSFTDLEIFSTLFSDRQYHIVMTLDGFVGKEWLMRSLGCIPARKFITDMPLVKDIVYCLKDLGSSVLMYPEASYSFDGTATALPSSVGKCLKLFNVPVVMITTEGAFHRDPLYNGLRKRDVAVKATVKYLLSVDDIKSKSVKELNEILKKEFSFDHWRWQRESGIKVTEPFRAEGLERVLYKCPVCGKERVMRSSGFEIACGSCGATWELEEDGALVRKDAETGEDTASVSTGEREDVAYGDLAVADKYDAYDFSYVSDWYRWERDMVKKEIAEGKYYLDIPVDIVVVKDTKAAYQVGEGRLVHSLNGFELTGCGGELEYHQSAKNSYSLYADYFWYEIGDMVSIGTMDIQYYCFPKDKSVNVAKVRLATEEMYKLSIPERLRASEEAM
ncbi:hypothetical protein D6853_06255 [Butyrivibrio sp. X503]|uniref:1-acyl-sn-glycerol-3-phosphate acyltransferase n=1 Tax=Butyrivibrio sp. X503 TaxID=2364878 RepID=UPI000EBD52EC|nr:1-acyl-sn-glycerol-3-phosphate acyltransferase [Butyrivibrio sp. X503]RKM56389.1 hypothetical protein D6853_06255 [Butyrivibrio sp. X503]